MTRKLYSGLKRAACSPPLSKRSDGSLTAAIIWPTDSQLRPCSHSTSRCASFMRNRRSDSRGKTRLHTPSSATPDLRSSNDVHGAPERSATQARSSCLPTRIMSWLGAVL